MPQIQPLPKFIRFFADWEGRLEECGLIPFVFMPTGKVGQAFDDPRQRELSDKNDLEIGRYAA
jgi:hypothetical protein